jgi:hypothetical protein
MSIEDYFTPRRRLDNVRRDVSTNAAPPWAPFCTLRDFETAEYFLQYSMSDAQINKHLKLRLGDSLPIRVRGHAQRRSEATNGMRTAHDFHQLLNKAYELRNDLSMVGDSSAAASIVDFHLHSSSLAHFLSLYFIHKARMPAKRRASDHMQCIFGLQRKRFATSFKMQT